MSFLSALAAEYNARRKRLRAAMGDRAQSLFEMLLLGALFLGSVGLFLQPWMPAAAPWGFAIPFGFVAAYLYLDARRQKELAADGADASKVTRAHDRMALTLALICMAAGVGAFAVGLAAEPPAPPVEWTPPPSAVKIDISP